MHLIASQEIWSAKSYSTRATAIKFYSYAKENYGDYIVKICNLQSPYDATDIKKGTPIRECLFEHLVDFRPIFWR
jgi:hypothetical protein